MQGIIYVSEYTGSSETIEFDLFNICRVSKKKNPAKNITGVLFYHQKYFLQLIEGESTPLRQLMNTLEKDPRHRNIRKIFDEEVVGKSYGNWNMDAFNIDDKQTVSYEKVIEYKTLFRTILSDFKPQVFIESLKQFLVDDSLKAAYNP